MQSKEIKQFSFCTSKVDKHADSLKVLNSNVIKSKCLYAYIHLLELLNHH